MGTPTSAQVAALPEPNMPLRLRTRSGWTGGLCSTGAGGSLGRLLSAHLWQKSPRVAPSVNSFWEVVLGRSHSDSSGFQFLAALASRWSAMLLRIALHHPQSSRCLTNLSYLK